MEAPTYIHGTSNEEQSRLSLLNQITNRPFIDFLDLETEGRVLEVGSGLGILAREVADQVPLGEVVGIEQASAQLDVARGRESANLRFVQGDAHALPFRDEEFDLVYCRYVLEHLSDPAKALEEMRRVLKVGGRVHLQENNILATEFFPDCLNFQLVWQQFAELQEALGGDALIGKKLFALLKSAGFDGVELSIQPEVHWQGSASFEPWISNLIGNLEGGRARLIEYALATSSEIDEAISDLRSLLRDPMSSAYFYWNRAKAVKALSR